MKSGAPIPYRPRVWSLVALGLAPVAALVLEALRAFLKLNDTGAGAAVVTTLLLAQLALLGWAALRLQKPLDEEVSWAEYRRLLGDWLRILVSLVWRVTLTVVVLGLPHVVARFSGADGAGAWWARPVDALVALGAGWWTFVYFWAFPWIATRRDSPRKEGLKAAWGLSLRYWYWPALFVGGAVLWAGFGPRTGAAADWGPFLSGAAALLFAYGQVLWLLSRPEA